MNSELGLNSEEIILNSRGFASFLPGRNQGLEFVLGPVVVKEAFEKDAVKKLTLSHSGSSG